MNTIVFPLSPMKFALFISVVLSFKLAAFFVDGQASFTRKPPNKLYVLSGKSATFSWEYTVVKRKDAFNPRSPKWSFFYENGTEQEIGNEYKLDNWNWQIASSCPQRLLKPALRVFKKENATLVITNVTTVDNGIYGCTLVLKFPPSLPASKAQLIVTDDPKINITGETSVTENANLTLICSAVGPPTPNVTWMNNAGVVLAQEIGSATLVITNIKREQAGIYKCNATNNPNEHPVQEDVTVTVKFPPNITNCTESVERCPVNKIVEIKSAAIGNPPPTYYWYNPQNISVGENITGPESKIEVVIAPGNWTCRITNGIGQDIYCKVKITVLPENDEKCKTGCTKAEVAGFIIGLIIAVVIFVVVIGFVYKRKKEKKDFTTRDKVLIVGGLIVAVIIIIIVIVFIIKCA